MTIPKFVRQEDSMDCGPACLAMIAEHYGRWQDVDFLREQCFIDSEGVSLLGISRAAEKIGFRTVGGRLTFDRLAQKATLPCIVHWNQNHFVVVRSITYSRRNGYKVQIADPSIGFLSLSKDEFCTSWISTRAGGEEKGIVLLLDPTESFFSQKQYLLQKKSRFTFLWNYVKWYKKFFFQLVIGLFVGALIQLVLPFLTQAIVDVGIGVKDIGFIWLILLAEMMLLFSRTAVDFIRNKILLHISTRINISLISDFFIKLMKLPMKFFDTKLLGDLLQRIDDHRRVEQFLTSNALNLFFSFFTFLIFGVVLCYYSLPIFIVFIVGSVLYGVWICVFLRKRKILDYKYFEQSGKNRNITYQLLNGMPEIKLQGCEQRKRWEWEDVQAELFDINLKSLNLQQAQQAGSITINELKNILITVLAATSVINGNMTLGMMLAVQYITGQLNSPVEQLINFIYSWQDVSISLDRMNEIHSEQNEENSQREIFNKSLVAPSIEIKNLCFKYSGTSPRYILNDINLNIQGGKVTAIVGSSGSGKTTLIKLLLGFYSPCKGQIEVNGQDLEKFNLVWWRKNCGAVMQDGFVFSDSIARNISVSYENPDIDRIRNAAKIACISDYIESLPLAYNTQIGQDGQGISQGQRQRILIARVIYRNPSLVILDEATNSLDASNERAIVNNLKDFYSNKTVIIVAHRLSTVKNADQIVVLDGGRIAEKGIHDELCRRKGIYYELVKNQLELGS